MRRWLLDLLACPACGGGGRLHLLEQAGEGDEIESGSLLCDACRGRWPIRDGIPRFVGAAQDYAAAFGWQWRRWRTIQIDHLNGHRFSEERLLRDSGWARAWFDGKTILDVGCGAGRFADVMGELGARVVAVDLSAAIDACRETCARHAGRVQCVQGSIYGLPLRAGAFDAVHCAGVIQHTPDPIRTMTILPAYLRPGGRLAYNFYEQHWTRKLQLGKLVLRSFTPRLSPAALLTLSRALVAVFFPVTLALSRVRYVRYLNRFFPIAATHRPDMTVAEQYDWTLLDTFDWYNPRYEHAQSHRAVARLLDAAGLVEVYAAPGIARARRPEAAHAPAQAL